MIDGGLPLKVVAIEAGGYDTHSNQLDSLPGDLLEIGDSLRAFQRDLEARGARRTACSCTCGASSAAGPRRTAPAPTTARPAPAS